MVKTKYLAFSLLEVVVVIGIFSAITMFLFPLALNQLQGNRIDAEVKAIKSAISNQAENAFANKNNVNYGIAFFPSHYILYSGETLATAESTDQYDFSPEMSISNINFTNLGSEINFTKGSFRPNTVGSFEIGSDGITYLITINSEGLILFSKI